MNLRSLLLCAAAGRNGTFVELGAYDGVRHSNTFALERCERWRGLLVEANPTNFAALAASVRNATKLHSGVCASDGGTLEVSYDGGEYSGDAAVASDHAHAVFERRQRHVHFSNVTQVPCHPLPRLMARAGLHARRGGGGEYGRGGVPSVYADFLSLDVEGSEAIVLETCLPPDALPADPAKASKALLPFGVVLVETIQSRSVSPKDAAMNARVAALLSAGGMERAKELEHWARVNHVWVSADVRRRCLPPAKEKK